MTSYTLRTFFIFIGLVLLQTLIFNHIHVLGGYNPMIYLLFFISYRFTQNQTYFILLGFAMGFCIDLLSHSAGAHTIASLFISFVRPLFIRNSYGVAADMNKDFKSDPRKTNQFIFMLLTVTFHHLIYFIVVYFSWDAFFLILKNTFLTSVFSLTLIFLTTNLYTPKQ